MVPGPPDKHVGGVVLISVAGISHERNLLCHWSDHYLEFRFILESVMKFKLFFSFTHSLQRRSSSALLIFDTATFADSGAETTNTNHREPHKQQFSDFTFVAAVESWERPLPGYVCSCYNKFTGAKEDMKKFRLKPMAGTYFMASHLV
jgi:hypothetical protein